MVAHAYNSSKVEVEAAGSGVQSMSGGIGAPFAKTKAKVGRCATLRMLKQEDEKFEASMSYVVRK